MQGEFRLLLEDSRSNFMALVVDVVEERMRVEGIRLSARSDAQTDQEAWDIWQANQMDAESQVAIIEALAKGVSYLSVWKTDADAYPTIAVEDPLQTIIAYAPGSGYRKRLAALKVWRDEYTGLERANVYLPEGIFKFESRGQADPSIETTISPTGDETHFGRVTPDGSVRVEYTAGAPARWRELADEFVGNPVGAVPIVALRNRPRLLREGQSEIDGPHRTQNGINGFIFLLALAGYFGAHKQRWAAGVPIAKDANGKPMELLSGVETIWQTDNPNAKFGEFAQTELDGYIKAIEQKVLHIAVTTRTPRHYLIEQGQSPSGDAIKSAEAGLTKKVERKMRTFGEGFEEALTLARLFAGADPKTIPIDSEIVWADPEIRTEAEITDAAIKKWSMGLITWEQALEDSGYTQTQIARMKDENGGVAPTPPSRQPEPELVGA